MSRRSVCLAAALSVGALVTFSSALALTPQEQLGRSIFFDQALSLKKNQSCAACHNPNAGWTGAIPGINKQGAVYSGSVKTRFGDRKPPSAAYATQAPVFYYDDDEGLFIGGNFWDGRATGERLGSPAAEQAQGPFLNPVEQALPDAACVVYRVCNANRAEDPTRLDDVSAGSCAIDWPRNLDRLCKAGKAIALSEGARAQVNAAYDQIAFAIAAYEGSEQVNAFSSKYDAVLAGKATLTTQEAEGFELFQGKALCAECHVLERVEGSGPALLTDFAFDNLGVPKNPQNPVYATDPGFVDPGLGGFLATRDDYKVYAAENLGKHKVPTLRNVDRRPGHQFTKAYMHNGYFKTLEGVVHFYNTRDTKVRCEALGVLSATEAQALRNNCWPAPDVAQNVNVDELGNLGLTAADEAALVAFMKTLSDGYVPKPGAGAGSATVTRHSVD